jgi:hypothetical protein
LARYFLIGPGGFVIIYSSFYFCAAPVFSFMGEVEKKKKKKK